MSKSIKLARYILCFLFTIASFPLAHAAMPTAGLPIEPASGDADLYSEGSSPKYAAYEEPQSSGALEKSSASSSSFSEIEDFGMMFRFSMARDGFGAQLKFMEYARSWLAMTQTFRYYKNDETARLFRQSQGFLLGADMHPWRKKIISPFLNLQGGWEKFYREDALTLDSFVVEASSGLELRLGRMVSLIGQWTESYYPGLDEPVFLPTGSNKDPKRRAVAEVMFNLKWE